MSTPASRKRKRWATRQMDIKSPGRREMRRQLELTHRRVGNDGRREFVAYRHSDQLSRVDLPVRVTAVARQKLEEEFEDIIEEGDIK